MRKLCARITIMLAVSLSIIAPTCAQYTGLEPLVLPQSQTNASNIPLIEAAARGDVEAVKKRLAGGTNINTRDSRGYSALMAALDNGEKAPCQAPSPNLSPEVYLTIVRFLLAHGASVNLKDNRGVTPLMLGIANGRPEIVPVLLARGAEVNARTNAGATPLMYAITEARRSADQTVMVTLMLSQGAFPNARDDVGNTALSLAAQYGSVDTLHLLLANDKNFFGNRAEEMRDAGNAAFVGRKDNVEILLNYSDPASKPSVATSALLSALMQGNTDATKDLIKYTIEQGADIEARDSSGWTPLLVKAYDGELDMVDFLLAHGADINATDNQGLTALRRSLQWLIDAQQPTESDHERELRQVAQRLLDKGADVDVPDRNGSNILFDAVATGDQKEFDFALSHGANVNYRNRDGLTPLYQALFSQHNALARRLLAQGANVNIKTKDGMMPLHIALERLTDALQAGEIDIVPDLIARGADVNAPGRMNNPPLETIIWSRPRPKQTIDAAGKALFDRVNAQTLADMRLLIAHGANVNNWNAWSSQTLLQIAAVCKDDDATTLLLKAGEKK